VRLHYPGATKRFAGDADRTTITRLVSVATRRKAAAASHSSGKSPSEKPAQGPEAALISKVSVTENLQWNIDAVLSHLGSTHQAPPASNAVAAQVARRAAPAVPPVERPALRPAQPAARVAPTVRAINAAPAPPATHAAPPRGPAARTVASGAAPPVAQAPLPAIDSTQTVRALTAVELDDGEVSRWFVLQLVQSHEKIDPEQVPSLDIFCEYRLYTVGEASAQGLGYALRLGFFSSEVAAKAVASYLAPHFPATNIKRISVAEHDRFAQNLVVAKKDVGETGRYAVIEFTSRPELPPMAVDTAAPLEADKPPPQAAASLWSRLVQRRVSR